MFSKHLRRSLSYPLQGGLTAQQTVAAVGMGSWRLKGGQPHRSGDHKDDRLFLALLTAVPDSDHVQVRVIAFMERCY